MNHWQSLLVLTAAALILFCVLRGAVRKSREHQKRDFTRKLETVLQSRENIKVICPQKQGQVILTTRRVLFDTPKGFLAVPLKSIKRVQGFTAEEKKTTSVEKMARLLIKAEKEHTISGTSEEFTQLAKQLIRKVDSQNRKKKADKEKRNEKK